MSLYVHWLNVIKERSTGAWLTDNQRLAYNKLLTQWQASPFVNLCGPPGSGKSFIARLLVKEHGYVYVHDLEEAPEGAQNVVVDDAVYSRLMRSTAMVRRLGRVVLITEQPIRETMPRAEITLGDKDVAQFLHHLYADCSIEIVLTHPQGTDLGQILRAEAIAKGGLHVA